MPISSVSPVDVWLRAWRGRRLVTLRRCDEDSNRDVGIFVGIS